MSKAFIFPGQGSQFVGMGKNIFDEHQEARLVFEEVDDALGEKLSDLIFSGPEENLTMTQNTQPALMATSIAVLRVVEKLSGKNLSQLCNYVAGHSLGEYSALCAAGAISLSDTARLLRIRGNAMQEAVPKGKGGMAALIGVEFDTAEEIASKASFDGETCQAANDNGGGQVVISGSLAAIDQAIEVAGQMGIKRAVKLPVSAPFHSNLMQPAAQKMQEALSEVEVKAPAIPLIANVTAKEVTDPQEIKDLLVKQVTGMVRWRESILYLASQGVESFIEVGAGKVLSNLVKRIDKSLVTNNVETTESISDLLK